MRWSWAAPSVYRTPGSWHEQWAGTTGGCRANNSWGPALGIFWLLATLGTQPLPIGCYHFAPDLSALLPPHSESQRASLNSQPQVTWPQLSCQRMTRRENILRNLVRRSPWLSEFLAKYCPHSHFLHGAGEKRVPVWGFSPNHFNITHFLVSFSTEERGKPTAKQSDGLGQSHLRVQVTGFEMKTHIALIPIKGCPYRLMEWCWKSCRGKRRAVASHRSREHCLPSARSHVSLWDSAFKKCVGWRSKMAMWPSPWIKRKWKRIWKSQLHTSLLSGHVRGTRLSALVALFYLAVKINQRDGYYCPHFTNGDVEVRRLRACNITWTWTWYKTWAQALSWK